MTARSRLGSEEQAAGALGRLLRESGEARVRSDADSELERLLRTADGNSPGRARAPAWRTWLLVAAVAVLVGSFGSFEWQRREGAALTFSTNGVARRGPVAIAADSERAVDLEFSDGTVFNVEPAARLRVESSSANGARLTLVAGKTIAHVVHRSRASWSVAAGPFEVRVTGTRFGARWDATHERLSVDLYEGSVQVVGGALTTPISVRAGQRLEAGRGTGDWLLTSLEGPATPLPSAPAVPGAAAGPSSTSEPSPVSDAPTASGSALRPAAPTSEWPAMLGRADFEGILRQADDFGIERCFSTCSSGALRTLADSARYLGRYSLAERSLLALRKRSPSDAGSTAFFLGRLEESRDPNKALSWYEKSLEEAPHGAYAAVAQAGKARMLQRR
jgi:transmembrane sensor